MSGGFSLFDWRTSRELDGLEAQRETLLCRMGRLAPMSHKRVIMQHQLTALTTQIMGLECELEKAMQS